MKILNLFAGIGGNRTLWGNDHEITAIEKDQRIACIYKKRFLDDNVIIGDAYDYFIKNFQDYEFMWASPPCQSHTILNSSIVGNRYKGKNYTCRLPDLNLYSLILFCKYRFRGDWIIENVIPDYKFLIPPTCIRGRHAFWSNHPIPSKSKNKAEIKGKQYGRYGKEELRRKFNASNIEPLLLKNLNEGEQHQWLNNLIDPHEGKYLLDLIILKKQKSVIDFLEV